MKILKFYTDGGCRKNPGPAASAVYLPETGSGFGKFIGESRTNNEAEAEAFVLGLEFAWAHDFDALEIFSDSQLLVHLVNGRWTPNAPTMKKMLRQIEERIYFFNDFRIEWVPREQNKEADWLCNQILDAAEKGNRLTCQTSFKIPSSLCSSMATG